MLTHNINKTPNSGDEIYLQPWSFTKAIGQSCRLFVFRIHFPVNNLNSV